ncbi:MAG: ATP-binding protein [Planctomycetota bacterium]
MARRLLVALTAALALALCLYFRFVLRTDIVYMHFAYIPVVLAGMWFGRRCALGLAAGLVAAFLLVGLLTAGTSSLPNDVERSALLVIAALVVGTLKDRVAAGEAALRISESRYRILTEKSLAGILVCRDERILFANARIGELLGLKREDLIGRDVRSFIYDGEGGNDFRKALNRGADTHGEYPFRRADGAVIWTEVAGSPMDFEGQDALLIHAYDITERKVAETKRHELAELARRQEEQLVHSTRLAELGEMAAGIAHELNQPLTGIKNFANNASFMIDHEAGTLEEVNDNLHRIASQVERASRLIAQMRQLARKTERHVAPVDITGTLRDAIEFLRPQFRLSGIDVELDLAGDLPFVPGDKIRLEQVILNLLTNAKQAMEDSQERRLSVRTRLERDAECPVVVEIADTGVGFADEDVEKLFRPFWSTKKPGQGTGLGLSISLSIVRDHGGRIEASGAPGKGATFTLRLPAAAQEGQVRQ